MSRDRIYLSPPDVGDAERAALLAAFDSGWIAPIGPDLDRFEEEIAVVAGTTEAVGLSSGTAALHLALLTFGVQPGDDVLVSTFTFAATANAVVYAGANPVFIDSEPDTWNMSPELLEAELTTRAGQNRLPAAVVVVDLYGQCADYDAIVPICSRFGVPLIEDAAEAIGATWGGRPAGSFGQAGVFSFNGNKIMTTSGGGMLVTDDKQIATRARYLATQARQPVVHYEHTDLGFNYRLSNLLAALGRAQLSRLPTMIERRRAIRDHYRSELEAHGIEFMPTDARGESNAWLACVVFDTPDAPDRVRSALEESNIEARPLWKPMHRQPYFAAARRRLNGFSDMLFEHGLCLPSGSSMTVDQVAEVAAVVVKAVHSTPSQPRASAPPTTSPPQEQPPLPPQPFAPTADVSPDANIGPNVSIWHLAQVRERAQIGANCIVGRGAYVGTGVHVGDNCKIQNYALVYEPAHLADGVFIGPAAVLTNDQFPRAVNPDQTLKSADAWTPVGVTVLGGASIGARAVCVAPVTIGRWSLVAAGSTVIRDVPDFALVAGIPAKRVGWVGRAGQPLRPTPDEPDGWTCPVTGTRYRQTAPEHLEENPE